MRLILFLIFIAVPLIELALIIKVGQVAGFWPTLGILIGTAFLGTMLLNRQGLAVMRRASDAVAQGKAPVGEVVDGAFIFMAGLLMITPGLITDAIGFVLLIPPIRRRVAAAVLSQMLRSGEVHVRTTRWSTGGPSRGPGGAGRGPQGTKPRGGPEDNIVIEADFERIDERTVDPRQPRPRDTDD